MKGIKSETAIFFRLVFFAETCYNHSEMVADIRLQEKETEGLLDEVLGV